MANGKVRKKSDISSFSVSIVNKALSMMTNQLVALAEDPERWAELSEQVRLGILVRLKSTKRKQLPNRKKK
jgi:hypothetical protein